MAINAADLFRSMINSPIAPWAIFDQIDKLQRAPQQGNEPDFVYNMRKPIEIGALPSGREVIAKALTNTPNARKAAVQKAAASDVFPTSYEDNAYSTADENAARITGVPVDLINRVRLLGERSNANQTSSAGAKTPYQITPETRQGIIKNYKIDPWGSPQNAALGAAYVLWEQAGRPSPKAWNDERKLKAVGGYFGGAAGAANPFGALSDGGTTVGEYTQRVLSPNTKLPFPALNPYDPTYDSAAMGQINKAEAALMQPASFSVEGPGPAPELPKPEPIPTTDFSKVDEDLQKLRPIEMTAKEQLTRERDGFFKGIAQAMMNMPANEGLGTFFMRLGGAALGGREAARDDIRKEQDKFDDQMSRFQAAVYEHDLAKAQTIHRETVAQVQQNNDYVHDQWAMKYDQWKGAGGAVNISGTNAVVTRKDANGNITANILPIPGAVAAAMAQERAQLFQSVGGRQFAGNQQITSMANAMAGRVALEQMSKGGSTESDAAATAAPAMYATFLVTHGGVADVVGADGLKSLEETIQKQLMQAGIQPGGKDYVERHDTLMAHELTKLGLASPDMMQKMIKAGAAMGSFRAAEALDATKTSERTDDRGRTTRTVTGPAAADMFEPSEFDDKIAPYGYKRY